MMQIIELFNRVHSGIFKSLLPALKTENLSVTEMVILRMVSKQKTCRMTDVARYADVPQSTFTGVVDRLVARGLLQRVYDTKDRRSVLVEGTAELDILIGRIMGKFEQRLKEILKDLPAEFEQRLISDLKTFYSYFENSEADSSNNCTN